MTELISLLAFAMLLAFYPPQIIKIYRDHNVASFAPLSYWCLSIGTGVLALTSWYGAAYWPFVVGNALNCVGAVWVLVLYYVYRDARE